MLVKIERVGGSPEEQFGPAYAVYALAEVAFRNLAIEYPALGVTPEQVSNHFNDVDSRAFRTFRRAASGHAVNRLGSREAQMYIAKDGQETIGWLTTAADHSDNTLHRVMKSYLWLVNGGVHPEYQQRGVMKELLSTALTDKKRPSVLSARTFVSAYPFVLPPDEPGKLPAVKALHKIGIQPTDPPFEDDAFFGVPMWMQRHQGGAPKEVAQQL
jgi:GNAT superfamily N-acetyltransferase